MVIAVVAVLAAMLLPALVRASGAVRQAACASNLRQLGLAMNLYVADHDESFPNTGDPYLWMGRRWRWPLTNYLGMTLERSPDNPADPNASRAATPAILLCPSDATAPRSWDSTSYAYSAAFYHAPADVNRMTTSDLYAATAVPCVTQRAGAVADPCRKALLGEWLSNHSADKVGWWDWRGARQYLFADGHTAFLAARTLRPAVNGFPDINLTVDGIAGRDVD